MIRTIIILFSLLTAFTAFKAEAQTMQMVKSAWPNNFTGGTQDDSLMFDGAFGTKRIKSYSGDCPVKVRYASGKNTGVRRIAELVRDCGSVVRDTLYRKEVAQLKKDDEVYLGEELSTGEDGVIELEIYEGSVLRMAPNSKLKITGEFCDQRSIFVFNGSIWTKLKKLLGGGKFEVSTERAAIGVRGTEFSVTAESSVTTLKVYEGKVATKLSMESGTTSMEDIGSQMEKLQQDYESGKISLEEFTRKMQENALMIQDRSDSMMKETMVEGGYMITATDIISQPVSIPAGDNRWFEDSKFFK